MHDNTKYVSVYVSKEKTEPSDEELPLARGSSTIKEDLSLMKDLPLLKRIFHEDLPRKALTSL